MTATIIDLDRKRAERLLTRRREREEKFDRELRRRLALFLEGREIPSEPIPDNPYI